MKCAECGNEMKKGIVEVQDGHLLPQVVVSWCPEEEKGKFIRKHAISLNLKA